MNPRVPDDRPRRGVSAMAWLLLLAAGQAASLSLIHAGNRVGYQHYRLENTGAGTWLAVAVIVAQALFVAASLREFVPSLSAWLRRTMSPVARVALLAAVFVCSATVSKDPVFYASELVVSTVIQLVALGNVIALGRAVNAAAMTPRLERWFGGPPGDVPPSGIDAFSIACAAWVLVAGTLLAIFSYQRHPHVPDEVVYLLQARYLAEGQLTMPLPPAPLAFNIDLMHYDATRWFSPVPPGWPFVLAIGAWFGAPWLVNPVLGAACILLTYAVLGTMYDRRVQRLATLFLALSPWFVFMSMNYMTHQVVLLFALLAALAVARLRVHRARGTLGSRTLVHLFLGGLAIGGASLVRPLEGLAVAVLLGVWSLPARWWKVIFRWWTIAPSASLALGAAAGGALVRPYNRLMTGDPSYFPIMAYIDKYYARGSNDLGFGANRGLGWSGLDPFPGHGAIDVVVNANLNVTAIGIELMGWVTGSLMAILLLLATRRMKREDWWHFAVLAVIAGIHSFYWFSGGPDFGARYWYLVIVSCAVLVARGVIEVGESLTSAGDAPAARDAGRTRAMTAGLALTVAALLTFFPWRAVDKYYHYRNMRPDVRALAKERAFNRSLVFIRGNRHPDYASAVAYNPIDLNADAPLYAWDVSPEARAEALKAYPDRPVWFLDGPTVSGDGFRVAAGPLTGAQALTFGAR